MEFSTTIRGNPSLLLNGFRYTKKREKKCGEVVWRCINRPCSAKVITRNGDLITEEAHLSCVPDVAATDVQKAMAQAKKRAREETDISISRVGLHFY